ncbi:Major allergen Pru ar 1 [Hibiscus syriacus]|uniref:Major allergen Pru ar 1 n=1 Tax=Hibiscus syriacus TaxID=106335 RepID=A0A6A3BB69_HIBSY|nr:Major allergen Pru ar 1 [Hibiscus syriacus]KAE8712362.1 Major allergen Pru ar 1 [Hibiscus syriacus]
MEVNTPIPPPQKAFKSFVLDYDIIFPKVVPHTIKSVDILEGDGGPGIIKKISFADENRSYGHSVIEGDILSNKLEKITDENKFEPAPNGGTIVKITTKFHTVGDTEMTEDEMKKVIESRARVFKAVEEYLVARHAKPNKERSQLMDT